MSDGGSVRSFLSRPARALGRYWWVVVASVLAGVVASWFLWSTHEPEYRATGSLWVGIEENGGNAPSTAGAAGTWLELLHSWSVLDSAAVAAGLHITAARGTSPLLLEGLETTDSTRVGAYVLTSHPDRSLRLLDSSGTVVDSAVFGDTIGTSLGFRWRPSPALLQPGLRAAFTLEQPRQAARRLNGSLSADVADRGSIIRVDVRGDDPQRVARAVNAVLARTVRMASVLKRAQLDERSQILRDELLTAEEELQVAENDLQRFGVTTATLPEGRTGVGSNPIFNRYAELRDAADAYASDRARLQEAIASMSESGVPPIEALEAIPTVRTSTELMAGLAELADARADLRALRIREAPGSPEVSAAEARVTLLERATIPQMARRLLGQLETREAQARAEVAETSAELTAIPPRAIEEARLLRQAEIAEQVYTNVRERYEHERIAAASSIPELRILDAATAPDEPSRDTITRLIATMLIASLAIGVVTATLADQIDPKLRRPADILRELGLEVVGTIPEIRMRRGEPEPASLAGLQEAFRHLRLNVAYAHRGGPVCLAVVGPHRGDGKTTVAANLATAFAETGRKALLIDADTHGGDLHTVLDASRTPGLTDVLAEDAALEDAAVPCAFDDLDFLPCGTRMTASPQLLGSRPMQRLLAEARSQYDVVIVDTPPLDSSSDGLVLAAMCGRMAMVVRAGATDKKAAAVSVERLRKLPMELLGVVLNGARTQRAPEQPLPDWD